MNRLLLTGDCIIAKLIDYQDTQNIFTTKLAINIIFVHPEIQQIVNDFSMAADAAIACIVYCLIAW